MTKTYFCVFWRRSAQVLSFLKFLSFTETLWYYKHKVLRKSSELVMNSVVCILWYVFSLQRIKYFIRCLNCCKTIYDLSSNEIIRWNIDHCNSSVKIMQVIKFNYLQNKAENGISICSIIEMIEFSTMCNIVWEFCQEIYFYTIVIFDIPTVKKKVVFFIQLLKIIKYWIDC